MFTVEASVFDVLEQDNTERRVASRRALALAHVRVESSVGKFLRGAQSEEEFEARLGLVQDDFEAQVYSAAREVGHDHPEHIATALTDHYRLALDKVKFEKTPEDELEGWEEKEEERTSALRKEAPGKQHMPGVSPKRNRQYEHIKEQLMAAGKSEEEAKEEAARTVNKQRSEHGETKGSSWTVTAIGLNPNELKGLAPQLQNADQGLAQNAGQGLAQGMFEPLQQSGPGQALNEMGQMAGGLAGPASAAANGLTGAGAQALQNPQLQQEIDPMMQKALSLAGSVEKAADGNTGLEGPEPKMDKRDWDTLGEPEVPGDIERKDIMFPIGPPMDRTEHPLAEIGDIKTMDMPSGRDGFADGGVTKAPGTKTFQGGGASAVTQQALSHAYEIAMHKEAMGMSAQDFRMLADAIRTAPEGADKGTLAGHVAQYLQHTNPMFDADRFMAAAIGQPSTGRDVYRGPGVASDGYGFPSEAAVKQAFEGKQSFPLAE